MRHSCIAVWASVAVMGAFGGSIEPGGGPAIKICVESEALQPFVIPRGESIAKEIFANIGIRIGWTHRAHCAEPAFDSMVMVISTEVKPELFPGALAYTRLGERRSEVFFNRVESAVEPLKAPNLLGHVLAHEIAHVLEGVSRHSQEGLMKAHWDYHDYDRMFPQPLPFAPEDVDLIRAGVQGMGITTGR